MAIHFRAQAVIQVCDGFTGQPVKRGTVRIQLPQGVQAVAKAEEIYVFSGCSEPQLLLSFISPVYEKKELTLDMGEENELTLKRIFLIPSLAMPFPRGTTTVEGCETPGSQVFVIARNPGSAGKLLKECQKADRAADMYHPQDEVLERRLLAFFCRETFGELVQINEVQSDGKIRFQEELTKDYKRVGTSIYPVWEGLCGADGHYRVAVGNVPGQGCPGTILVQRPDGTRKEQEIRLRYGERNRSE